MKVQLSRFENHTAKATAVAYSTNNQVLLCSAGLDGVVNFYDSNEKTLVKQLKVDKPITSMAFFNDGFTIVVGTAYGELLVYDLKGHSQPKLKLVGHPLNQAVSYISFLNYAEKSKVNVLLPPKATPPSNPTTTPSSMASSFIK